MKKMSKKVAKLVKKAINVAKKYGVDPSTLDFSELVDPTLSDEENMAVIMEKIYSLIPSEEKKIEFREKYMGKSVKAEAEKSMRELERAVDEHIKKMMSSIKPNKTHPYYRRVMEYVRLLTSSDRVHLLVIMGEGGVGKTHITLGALNELRIPYEYVNGVTAYELFNLAWEHSEKVIVLDDIVLTPEMIRLLKAMCDTKQERTVTWISRAKKNEGANTRFIFRGKIILIVNDLSLETDEHYTALLSRGFLLKIRLTKSELMALIRAELGEEYYRMFVGDLREMYKKVPERFVLPLINLRTAIKYKTAVETSRTLARMVLVDELLERARDLKLAVENGFSKFSELTGMSKRTWCRYRVMYRYLVDEFLGGQ